MDSEHLEAVEPVGLEVLGYWERERLRTQPVSFSGTLQEAHRSVKVSMMERIDFFI